MMKFAYQNAGSDLVSWRGNHAPYQSRSGTTRSLGSLGDTSLSHPTLVLPVPGGPEPLNGDCGCGCKGAGTCGGGMGHDGIGAITDTITSNPIIAAGLAYLAYRMFFKKKRR